MGLFSSKKHGTFSGSSSVRVGYDRQPVCHGCQRVELHLEEYLGRQHAPDKRVVYHRALAFHSDFAELEQCAIQSRCSTCCLFRQALLLACTTSSQADDLFSNTRGRSVYATFEFLPTSASLPPSTSRSAPSIVLEIPDVNESLSFRSVPVSCVGPTIQTALNLCENPRDALVYAQARQWVDNCHNTHISSCATLRYSSENPTRLVHASASGLRLVETVRESALAYVALSYAWGNRDAMSAFERTKFDSGQTRRDNIEKRRYYIDPTSLPATVSDTIEFARNMGISYIWIDALCVLQGDDPEAKADQAREMPRMHEYYGNAHFTFCVSASTKCTEGFLRRRTAWSIPTKPCRLSGQGLVPITKLNDVRAGSHLATRAWTLQEERLSPRILYWTPQRMFWSCAHHQLGEQHPPSVSGPPRPSTLTTAAGQQDFAQSFLRCTVDDMLAGELHLRWLAMLESYTRRNITKDQDVFPAVAGLAARYLDAQLASDVYIAGLWRDNFAAGLAWAVDRPGDAGRARQHIAPSWSWASLPACTPTTMVHSFAPSDDFVLLDFRVPKDALEADMSVISRGALVKKVRVRGRLRPFWPAEAVMQPWQTVARQMQTREEFFFDRPEQAVVAADLSRGLVLSREARRKEVVGRLDYRESAGEVLMAQTRVLALEVGEEAMLLLVQDGCTSDEYRRVGVARGYRRRFFEAVPVRELWLV